MGPNGFNFDIFTVDILTLRNCEYLNDQIIDFWLIVTQMESFTEQMRAKTFVFDSYFYKTLTQEIDQHHIYERYNSVEARTKHVDVFSKDYLVIPINEK